MLNKRRKPRFARQHMLPHGRVSGKGWRKPRGTYSKQARRKQSKGARPNPGYGQPANVWGLHPSGLKEVLVFNEAGLHGLDPKKNCARIGGSVGLRKRKLIAAAAAKAGLRILNAPKPWQKKPEKRAPVPAAKPVEKKPAAKPEATSKPERETAATKPKQETAAAQKPIPEKQASLEKAKSE